MAARTLAFLLLALSLLACSGGEELAGEWDLVETASGAALGEVLTLNSDDSWSRTGTPSYEGTYSIESGVLELKIEKYGKGNRAEFIDEAVSLGQPRDQVEQILKSFDDSQKFDLVDEDGATVLRQLSPHNNSALLIFRKREDG